MEGLSYSFSMCSFAVWSPGRRIVFSTDMKPLPCRFEEFIGTAGMATSAAAVLATSDSGSPFDEDNKKELKRLQEVRLGTIFDASPHPDGGLDLPHKH